jgi:plastocyanin
MRKLVISLLFAIPLVVAACGATASGTGGAAPGTAGGPSAGGSTVTMNAINFLPNNSAVTIKAGQAITFVDPAASGGLHFLVTGTNGTLTKQAGGPPVLSTQMGMQIMAGDTKVVTFPSAGTFMITCTIHPYMELAVTVTQ